jgi:hypothetical protein
MISSLFGTVRRAVLVPLVGLVGLLVVAGWFFQPWTAFFDDVVHEASPASIPGIRVLATGEFTGSEYQTRGTATLYELSDGSQLLRLEGLQTRNGPRLKVALADALNADGTPARYVDLGAVKGNIGEANYPLPVGAGYPIPEALGTSSDAAIVPAVVIWSMYGPAHGTAALTPVR